MAGRLSRVRQRRGMTLGLLTALIAIAYIDRVSVTHAIGPASVEFGWDAIQTGWVLSAFSWGYVIAMTPGGWLVDRLGANRAIIGGAAIWGIISASALAATGAVTLAFNRFFLGVSEAPAFPAAAAITARNFSAAERGRATALFDGGSYIGMALGAPLVAGAVVLGGWRTGFLAAAALTGVWLLVALILLGRRQRELPLAAEDLLPRPGLRIAYLLKQPSIWSFGVSFLGYNYVKSFYLTWFALYLTRYLGISQMATGAAAVLPPLLALVASVSVGHITDRMAARRAEGELGRLRGRVSSGAMAAASLIAVVPALPDDTTRILVLSIAFAANISASPGIWALPGDLAPTPHWIGTIGGVVNTMSNIGGIVSPIITGYLVHSRSGSYDLALVVTGGIALASSATFLAGRGFKRLGVPLG